MYETPNGRRFTLYHHSPKEWAAKTRDRLLYLGCSEEYADSVCSQIAAATLVTA